MSNNYKWESYCTYLLPGSANPPQAAAISDDRVLARLSVSRPSACTFEGDGGCAAAVRCWIALALADDDDIARYGDNNCCLASSGCSRASGITDRSGVKLSPADSHEQRTGVRTERLS